MAERPSDGAGSVRPGTGLLFAHALGDLLERHDELVDYVEVIPEAFFHDRWTDGRHRYEPIPAAIAALDRLAEAIPLVAHGIGLSIATAGPADDEQVAQLERWTARYGFHWVSEHLSATRVTAGARLRHTAVGLALPYDADVLDDLGPKVAGVVERLPVPFLLENPVSYVRLDDEDLGEAAFLSGLAARSGCGILLDLHNLYCDARNHGPTVEAFVDAYVEDLDLGAVEEIHVAGGAELAGMWTDAHAGAVPEVVWELAERIAPSCPNLRGITFEFHESYLPGLGMSGVVDQLVRVREVAERCTRSEVLA